MEPIEPRAMLEEVDKLGSMFAKIRTCIGEYIYGQNTAIQETLITLLSGGHVLLVGVPGLGKTRLVEVVGFVFGLDTRRVQFTPDLMPTDIIGSEVLEKSESGNRRFRFIKGPVFSQLLMADEINRASPRTQSALLQAMQESRVSVAGVYHDLPSPFHVLATQNPIEQEGTFPLPEAQLDRFFMQVDVDYPDIDSEREILINTTGSNPTIPEQLMRPDELILAQKLVRRIPIGKKVTEAIINLTRSGRPESSDLESVRKNVAWGPGPRAGQALMLGVRARALMECRLAPSVDDVIALSKPVLRHRMSLTFAARAEGANLCRIIEDICERIG